MGSKINKNLIELKLKKIFPDYSFDMSNYTNTHSKIPVTCPKHGTSNQLVKNLLKGHGCNKCGNEKSASKQRLDFNEIISNFNSVHDNKYDYSKFNYVNNREPSIIICPKHGEFNQGVRTHMMGHGCPMCAGNKKLTNSDFISRSKKLHTINYDYDSIDYKNMHSKVKIKCPVHGYFEQIPLHHINGVGCPKCNQSKGEKLIDFFLKQNKIEFIHQMKFDKCFYLGKLPFDFYLPDYNTCIEFNGIQHYYPIDIFGGEEALRLTKIRDEIKSKFCNENGIKLIVIKQDKKHINLDDVDNQIKNIINIINESIIIKKFNHFKL
jgi:hypothetical protein